MGLRPTNRDESAPPVIPSVARNLLLLFFKKSCSLALLGMTSAGLFHQRDRQRFRL